MPAISRIERVPNWIGLAEEKPSWLRAATLRLTISTPQDVVVARRAVREFSNRLGFDCVERTVLAAMLSELSRTFVAGAGQAELVIRSVEQDGAQGIQLEASGADGAIPHPGGTELVRLNQSLVVVRRLADVFEMTSKPGGGTVVRVTKWMR